MQQSQIDLTTVKLAVDTANSKADLFLLPGAGPGATSAHCHMTRGANRSGDGRTFGDAIRMTATVDILLGPTDAQDWSFNFLQFANLMVRSALWGGRTAAEGSVSINYAIGPAFATNPSLDSTTDFDPFVNLLGSPQSEVPDGAQRRITLTRIMGDHPNSKQPLQLTNFATKCPNFLQNIRLDVGFTTVFVARSPASLIVPLAHFTWHLVYDARFTWSGNTCAGVMSNGRLDVGPVKAGVPADPTLQSLLKSPKGPFYNDLCRKATTLIANMLMPPNYVESTTRDPSIPPSFFT